MNSGDVVMAVCVLIAALTTLTCSFMSLRASNEVYKLAQAEEQRRRQEQEEQNDT